MAEPAIDTGAAASNDVRPVASGVDRFAQRAATLAALQAGEADAAPANDEQPAPVEAAPDITEAPEAEPAVESTPEPEAEAAPAEPDPAPAVDPNTAKRLATVQAAEKRAKEALAKERAEIAAARAEVEQLRAELDAYRQAKERAKLDPVGLLEAAGVDDLEYAARLAYTKAKASTDPAQREAAARMMRERETTDASQRALKEVEALKAEIAKRDQMQQWQQAQAKFLDDVSKTATAETATAPLLRAQLTKNPARAHQAIMATAAELFDETGEWPDASDVITTYESRRRAELAELGIDAPVPQTTKKQPQAAGEKRTAKTLTTDLSTSTPVPRAAKSLQEQREETRRMLEAGKLE